MPDEVLKELDRERVQLSVLREKFDNLPSKLSFAGAHLLGEIEGVKKRIKKLEKLC